MLKYIVIALVGIGIYIGVTYKDQIEDMTNSRPMEDVQDIFEDAKEHASDKADELSKQLEELSK
ncbi:YtxH domain-containing protein [Photobacterium sp. SDRW27]|uniref:YtxH domain-containing protein n=1 Tax=Photobacterium obscurum TaxID=2829490 RepID=UPI0022441720|nr:YtxH domain-containing protein [Photobacterium obscurum]MCW8330203.1 YtxH domain-containing protein [Photobacterium obscurum]